MGFPIPQKNTFSVVVLAVAVARAVSKPVVVLSKLLVVVPVVVPVAVVPVAVVPVAEVPVAV